MYYIENIPSYNQLNPEFPIIKRKKVLSFDDLLNNKELDECCFREEIISEFLQTNADQKKQILKIFSQLFFSYIFDENKNIFYKVVKKQHLPLTEHEKDLLFIVFKIFKKEKNSILLNYNHNENNKLYQIAKLHAKHTFLLSYDVNWLLNFHPNFEFFGQETSCSEQKMEKFKHLLLNYKPVYYVEGKEDYEIYSILYPTITFSIENGSANIIELMKTKNTSVHIQQSNKAIIDKDAYSSEAIQQLKLLGIKTTPFSELENIWLDEFFLEHFFEKKKTIDLKENIIRYASKNFEQIFNRFTYRQKIYENMQLPYYNNKQLQQVKSEFLQNIAEEDYKKIILWLDGKNVINTLFPKIKIDKKQIIKKHKDLQTKANQLLQLGALNGF